MCLTPQKHFPLVATRPINFRPSSWARHFNFNKGGQTDWTVFVSWEVVLKLEMEMLGGN